MQSPEGANMSRSRSRSKSRSRSASPPTRRRTASGSPSPRRRSYTRSRSRSPRRHRSRSGSGRNGYEGSSRRKRSFNASSRSRHQGTREDPEPCKCLGVFGLSLYTTERELQSIFDKYGNLEKVQVVLDAKTGKSRGFAFVYFEHVKDATEARNQLTGIEVDGRRIRVDFSITQRPHTPTPGIYMGNSSRGSERGYGRGGGGGYRDRYRSPSPRYRQRSSGGRRNDYYERGYERGYDRAYDRYDRERSPYHEKYSSRYDRSYDKYDKYDKYDRYDKSRSRSYSPRK